MDEQHDIIARSTGYQKAQAWDVVLANNSFFLTLVLDVDSSGGENGGGSSSSSPADGHVWLHAVDDSIDVSLANPVDHLRDRNVDQDTEMTFSCAEFAREVEPFLRSRYRVVLKSVARLALALGKQSGTWTGWQEKAMLGAIVALRQLGPPDDFLSRAEYRRRAANCSMLRSILENHTKFNCAMVEEGVSALCRITPFTSLSFQAFNDAVTAGPVEYEGESLIRVFVCEDMRRSAGDRTRTLVLEIMRAWPTSLRIQRSGLG